MNTPTYLSDIAIPPGETLLSVLEKNEMSQKELSLRTAISEKHLTDIVKGNASITLDTALKFEKVFEGTASFWINLEQGYQEDLARIEEAEVLQNKIEVSKNFNYKELENCGYVPAIPPRDYIKKAQELLKFFKVTNFDTVYTYLFRGISGAYFRNGSQKVNKESLATWLRCGEIEAEKIKLEEYNKRKFSSLLPRLKNLTLCPDNFGKILQEECASCGVAVSFVPYFKNTKINGAVRWIKRNKHPLIQLNSKGCSADSFWFTFFHEAGHVLNHSKTEQFWEFSDKIDEQREKEADSFAEETLIPVKAFQKFVKDKDFLHSRIEQVAENWGVPSSIVSGRLAKQRKISYPEHSKYRLGVKITAQ